MFNPSTIFQRTQDGRDEIRQKRHGLTQSERLVLIMIDGVSSYQEVRNKVPSLTDERFNRALSKLQQKELVLEVFMPVEGQVAEELESAVVERFLHQDPLDPVTIIMRDPDEELEGLLGIGSASVLQSAPQLVQPEAVQISTILGGSIATSAPPVTPPVLIPEPVVAMDEAHNEMADSLAQEVRRRQMERPTKMERFEADPIMTQVALPPSSIPERLHWGHWLIGIGCMIIAGFFLARIGG